MRGFGPHSRAVVPLTAASNWRIGATVFLPVRVVGRLLADSCKRRVGDLRGRASRPLAVVGNAIDAMSCIELARIPMVNNLWSKSVKDKKIDEKGPDLVSHYRPLGLKAVLAATTVRSPARPKRSVQSPPDELSLTVAHADRSE